MKLTPFTIKLEQAVLDDLHQRLSNTRWPNTLHKMGRQEGPELRYMQELVQHWLHDYKWRTKEQDLNRFSHFLAKDKDIDLHFIHQKSEQQDALPIVLLHGWADSFYRYIHLIERLTTAKSGQAFHVIVPSLPGFDFSGQPTGKLDAAFAADKVARLMEALGYDRYMVHGGDWGSAVAQEVARNHPEKIIGMHLQDVPFGNIYLVDQESATKAEKAYFKEIETWGATENGYVSIQSTKPLMLAYGLTDSPVGLAAWLVHHFQYLSEKMPSKDDLITNVMLYWANRSIYSSVRYYSEGMGGDWSDENESGTEDWGQAANATAQGESQDWQAGSESDATPGTWVAKIDVPTAIAIFPKDIGHPPQEFAERFFDVRRFTAMSRGGHFAALEVPAVVEEDIRVFAGEVTK